MIWYPTLPDVASFHIWNVQFILTFMGYYNTHSLPHFMFQLPFSGGYMMQAPRLLNGEKLWWL